MLHVAAIGARRAHAFGPGRPHRDLYLSPDHAIHVDGMTREEAMKLMLMKV